MLDLNRVMLIGRSTTDLEVKKIGENDTSVVNFNVATNRRYTNKEWNQVEEAEFHRCVAFWNTADILWKYLEKWKRVYIEGRLRTRKWEDSNWNNRYTTEIVVDNFIFLDSKWPSTEGWTSEQSQNTESSTQEQEEDLPF